MKVCTGCEVKVSSRCAGVREAACCQRRSSRLRLQVTNLLQLRNGSLQQGIKDATRMPHANQVAITNREQLPVHV
jgi:hypothetical protein